MIRKGLRIGFSGPWTQIIRMEVRGHLGQAAAAAGHEALVCEGQVDAGQPEPGKGRPRTACAYMVFIGQIILKVFNYHQLIKKGAAALQVFADRIRIPMANPKLGSRMQDFWGENWSFHAL